MKNNKYILIIFSILGNLGIFIYLVGSIGVSMFYLFDDPYDYPFTYSDVSGILYYLTFISILTALCILVSRHRYLVGIILMILSTIFFCIWIFTPGDVRKAGVYSIVLNTIIIAPIVYNLIRGIKMIQIAREVE